MVGAKTPPGDPPAGPQRIRGPSNMSSGGPKLKSSHPCRNSAVDGLPSTTRAAAQTWSTTRETRIGDTRDRFETLSDTPRVPQPRRSSSGPGADRHDHSERSTRTAGAATRARVISDMSNPRHAGNLIATLSLRDSLRAADRSMPQDRHIAPRRVEMARIQRPRSPRNRARLWRSRAARRRSPAGAARARRPPGRPADRAAERNRQSRALPSDRLPSALEPLENFRPVRYKYPISL
jgi:hypothetical protein